MKRLIVLAVILSSVGLFSFTILPVSASDSDFSDGITVDSIADGDDDDINDAICADSFGNCTLRAALQEANNTVGTQTIEFNIAPFDSNVKTIQPATNLPAIEDPVIIDGYTQDTATPNSAVAPAAFNGTLLIEIDGSLNTDINQWGMLFNGDTGGGAGSVMRGLVINRFDGNGVMIGADDITVAGNYIGTSADGLTDLGNSGAGVNNGNTSHKNALIGGISAADRNIISGNEDAGSYPQDGWIIRGNYIGVDSTGLGALGNSTIGASGGLSIDNCDGVIVGGSESGAVNVISANLSHGVAPDDADDLIIQGNLIGVGRNGTTVLGNGGAGIVLTNSLNAQIGGYNSGEANVVSNNGADGIYLGSINTGVIVQGNTVENNDQDGISVAFGSGIIIGGTQTNAGNSVNNSTNNGINIFSAATDVTVQGNDLANNTQNNVNVNNVTGIVIGGTQTNAGNNVTNAGQDGINISNASTNVTVQGNTIDNSVGDGVQVDGSSAVIGGYQAGAGNDISLSGSEGILISNSSTSVTAQGNTVSGSTSDNVEINASSAITIGGTQAGADNILESAGSIGLHITSVSSNITAQGNSVDDSSLDGIYVNTSSNIIIQSSNVTLSAQNGISIDNSSLVQLLGNDISTSTDHGISIADSDGTVISGGASYLNGDTSADHGININNSDDVSINDVDSSQNTGHGVNLSTINATTINGSLFSENGDLGINLVETTNTLLTTNTVVGNDGAGLALSSTTSVTVGGTTELDRNRISNNHGQANILIVGIPNPTTETVIQGNYIGTDTNGEVNDSYVQNMGIILTGAVSDTLIGGTTSGTGNIIADSTGNGVMINGLFIGIMLTPNNNSILGNSIHSSVAGTIFGLPAAGIGIDLATVDVSGPPSITDGGVTTNDATDADSGPNNLTNFPVLNSAAQNDNALKLNLDLDVADSTLNNQYRVEVFSNDSADPSGFGEGQTYLGAATLTNGDNQETTISLPSGTNLTGKVLSATTTALSNTGDGFGSTSEFSETLGNVSVTITPPVTDNSNSNLLDQTGDIMSSWYGLAGLVFSSTSIAYYVKYGRRTKSYKI